MVAGVARSSLTGFDESVECGALCKSFVQTGVGASDVGAYGHHLPLEGIVEDILLLYRGVISPQSFACAIGKLGCWWCLILVRGCSC